MNSAARTQEMDAIDDIPVGFEPPENVARKILSYRGTEILENLYLGNMNDAKDIIAAKNHLNVKFILNCSDQMDYEDSLQMLVADGVDVDFLNLKDDGSSDMFRVLKENVNKIDSYLEKNKRVLVHCVAGVNRSASLVVAYIMWKRKVSLIDANNFVRKKRMIVDITELYWRQLKEWEKRALDY